MTRRDERGQSAVLIVGLASFLLLAIVVVGRVEVDVVAQAGVVGPSPRPVQVFRDRGPGQCLGLVESRL